MYTYILFVQLLMFIYKILHLAKYDLQEDHFAECTGDYGLRRCTITSRSVLF
jgi:hypothetical protein